MFHRLKLYTVHVKPDDSAALEQPVFIAEGFNFWAFIFGPLWAVYHRLWAMGVLLLLVEVLLMALEKNAVLQPQSVGLLVLGYKVLVGYLANDWWRRKLERRHYAFYDVVASDSELRAEQRYFDRIMRQRAHA